MVEYIGLDVSLKQTHQSLRTHHDPSNPAMNCMLKSGIHPLEPMIPLC